MLSSMICGAPNMRHGRNAFAWKKAFCCCFVVSNLSGKRICSFFWQFLCFIFALVFQWLFDEHGTPVSHFSVGAGFSKSTQTSTARWYDHQYGSSRWLLAEAWCSGVWAQVLSVHGRQDQIVGWCWLHNSIDFVVCWGKKPSGHFESPHHVYAGAAGYEIINLSLHRPAYQWSNEEVRFFWALIYDLVESVSDGWDVACVAGSWFTHERVLNIYLYTA